MIKATSERNFGMSKYIIRNCPSCTKQNDCIAMYLRTSVECNERTDCIMKQIYELCKRQKESSYMFAVAFLADRILKLLDIQEVKSDEHTT